jgi:hypothetical protein
LLTDADRLQILADADLVRTQTNHRGNWQSCENNPATPKPRLRDRINESLKPI